MRVHNIASKVKRRFKYRVRGTYQRYLAAKNLLINRSTPTTRNQVWTGDITYIRVNGRWAFLAVVMDLGTRKIIGWSFAQALTPAVACEALEMAMRSSKPSKTTIFHSDQGIEYASSEFRKALGRNRLIQSMSRKGHCWDNAHMESFFHSLKTEMVYFNTFSNFIQATAYIMDYITFYNHKRLHSSLSYSTPESYYKHIVNVST